MKNINRWTFHVIQKIVKSEIKKQEESACFLLAYQPEFPKKKNEK